MAAASPNTKVQDVLIVAVLRHALSLAAEADVWRSTPVGNTYCTILHPITRQFCSSPL